MSSSAAKVDWDVESGLILIIALLTILKSGPRYSGSEYHTSVIDSGSSWPQPKLRW